MASVFFIISALTEFGLGRHRKKEQRFGPSPANNYTSGYGRGGFGRLFRRKTNAGAAGVAGDPNALPMHTTPDQVRQSHQTEETYVNGGQDTLTSQTYPKHGEAGYATHDSGVTAAAANPPYPHTANNTTTAYGSQYRYGDGTYQA